MKNFIVGTVVMKQQNLRYTVKANSVQDIEKMLRTKEIDEIGVCLDKNAPETRDEKLSYIHAEKIKRKYDNKTVDSILCYLENTGKNLTKQQAIAIDDLRKKINELNDIVVCIDINAGDVWERGMNTTGDQETTDIAQKIECYARDAFDLMNI